MGMYNTSDNDYGVKVEEYHEHFKSPPPAEAVRFQEGQPAAITDWLEMWDYVGGIRFRGFVAEKEEEKAMFVFFDQSAVGGDLKAGYVLLSSSLDIRTQY